MQNSIIVIITLSLCFLGCQSASNSQWLTLPKGSKPKILGQAAPDPFANAPIFPPPSHDPFASSTVSQSVIDTSAAEAAAEKERIKALATTVHEDVPDYLKPLNPWNGPFQDRVRTKNLEQDIVRQTGYDQVSQKIYSSEPEFDWEKTDHTKGFSESMFDPANSYRKVRDMVGLGPDAEKASEEMQKGREILQANPDLKDQKKCLEAAKHFVEAGKKHPDSVLEEDALHLAGECYFFADDYPQAFVSYQKLLIKYQHSKHMDHDVRRIFKIAQYWERESEKGASSNLNFTDKSLPRYDAFGFAKKAYETIFINDPNGPISDDALMALATAYLKRGRYQGDENFNQAAYYYQRLREDYPLSKHLAKAYEQELFARTQAYMGAEHPNKTLEEAGKLAEITLQQFSGELNHEEKADLLKLQEDILTKEAERLWLNGQFWDVKKRHYGSARVSYEQLINEYPQTEYAEKARKRMAQIEGLPDTPPLFGFPVNPFKAAEE